MRTRKAQTLSPDFTISFVIFLMIIVMGIKLWDIASEKELWIDDIDDLQKKARTTADILILTPGMPEGWDNETVVFLGLAEEDHVLNKTKLLYFRNLSYERARALMRIGANDFKLNMKYKNGSVLVMDGENMTYGKEYANADNVVHSERLTLVNDSGNLFIAKLDLILWRD